MPLSYQQITCDGVNRVFAVPFPYILKGHVHLYLGYDPTTKTYTSEILPTSGFAWLTGASVETVGTLAAGTVLSLVRITPTAARLVDWQNGSPPTAENLDTADLQVFYIAQELQDLVAASVGVVAGDHWSTGPGQTLYSGSPWTDTDAQIPTTKSVSQRFAALGTPVDGTVTNAKVAANADIATSKLLFTPLWAGSTPRTVLNRLRDFFTPFDFGATGDNSTDDTGAFTAMLAAFPGAGIDLRGRTYRVAAVPNNAQFFNGNFTVNPATTDDQPANAAFGLGALLANTYVPRQFPSAGPNYAAGNYNSAFGIDAMGANTTGRRNTGVGSQAMRLNTTGFYNTAIGAFTLYSNVIGNYNVAVGNQSLQYATGSRNVGVGNGALTSASNGSDSVAVGDRALGSASSSDRFIAIGTQAGWFHTGVDGVAIGHQALSASGSSGNYNVSVGPATLGSCTTGNSNVAFGRRALGAITASSGNVAVGNDAMVSATGGDNNVAVGNTALGNNTTGIQNVAVGLNALVGNTTGNNNVAVGRRALFTAAGGSGNVAIGNDAMVSAAGGSDNTAVGNTALPSNTTGSQNVAVGLSALSANTTGNNNTAIGRASAIANTTGFGQTAIGEQSLVSLTSGDNNTAVGRSALSASSSISNSSGLGYNSQVTGSNQVQLGDASTTAYAYGAVQNRSDARDKADVRDTVLGLSFINALRPVDYRWDYREAYRQPMPDSPLPGATKEEIKQHEKAVADWRKNNAMSKVQKDGSNKRNRFHHGLIAQEVKATCDKLGIDFGGYQDHKVSGGEDVLSIGYAELIGPLVKAVQELSAEVSALKAARGL